MKYRTLIAISLIFIISGFTFVKSYDTYFEIFKYLDLIGKIFKEVSLNYVDELNYSELVKSGINGMLENLDPYTDFIDESEKRDAHLLINGKYGGIGVTINLIGDKIIVTDVIESSPAYRQGIKIGDVIYKVDSIKVHKENYNEVSNLVKGEPGTDVEIIILRNQNKDTLTFKITREEIFLKSLSYFGFYPLNSNNAYLKLTSFNKSVSAEIQAAIKKLRIEKPIESVILDLRGNPGGLLESAVEVCDKFLKKNLLIVSTRSKDPTSERKYYSAEEPLFKNQKLIILIDENSASAAEVVAGAIQDHDRGIILGTQSFGKGLVQTITPITNKFSLKMTTAKYYTPSGRSIQKMDYIKNNNVIKIKQSDSVVNYFTDNNRIVYSEGGILPDTIVESHFNNYLIKQLISKNLIYQFVDSYSSNKSIEQFKEIYENELFEKFKVTFLKNLDKIRTTSLIKLNELIAQADKDSLNSDIKSDLNVIKTKINQSILNDLYKNKSIIIGLIKVELIKKYFDSKKSFYELLKIDNQVHTALNILQNDETYYKILNQNK